MEATRERMKSYRKTFKEIEAKLHPCPTVNGCEILHTHYRSGRIVFTAWIGGQQATPYYFEVSRWDVWMCDNFYETYKDVLYSLTKKE